MKRFREIVHLLNLPCRDVARLASESLDRDLPTSERLAVGLHTVYCVACRRHRRQVRFLRAVMNGLRNRIASEDHPDLPSLPAETREQIRKALKEG